VILTVFLSLVPAYGDTNVLENPGFESGIKGWAGRSCKIDAVTTPVHSGSAGAKASGRSETWQGIKQSLLGKVSNGNTYKISAWVRLENSDGDTVTVSIEQAEGDEPSYINVNSDIATNSEWIQLQGEFTPNFTGTPKTLDIYFEGPAPDVNFFVDDVVVYGAAPAGQTDPNAPKTDPNAPKQQTKADISSESAKVNSTCHPAVRSVAEIPRASFLSSLTRDPFVRLRDES
jgi:hypothetical protein